MQLCQCAFRYAAPGQELCSGCQSNKEDLSRVDHLAKAVEEARADFDRKAMPKEMSPSTKLIPKEMSKVTPKEIPSSLKTKCFKCKKAPVYAKGKDLCGSCIKKASLLETPLCKCNQDFVAPACSSCADCLSREHTEMSDSPINSSSSFLIDDSKGIGELIPYLFFSNSTDKDLWIRLNESLIFVPSGTKAMHIKVRSFQIVMSAYRIRSSGKMHVLPLLNSVLRSGDHFKIRATHFN